MTKSDLVKTLADTKDIQQAVAERIINEVFDCMSNTLISDGRIEIRGFGSFENRQYVGRTGRNPKSGEMVKVAPKKIPFFKVGKEIKNRIMGYQNYA